MSRTAVIGMFDGVHRGHRFLLDFARSVSADLVPDDDRVLAVTFSNHPLETIAPERAPKLLTLPDEKGELLTRAGEMPLILPFDNALRAMTAEQFMARLKHEHDVDTLIIGFNNRFGSDRHLTFKDYRSIGKGLGIEVVEAPEAPLIDGMHISSSEIRNLLNHGKIAEANALLGYRYSITGEVVSGNRIGRTIGFPTANLAPGDSRKLIPAPGVYVARAVIDKDNAQKNNELEASEEYVAIVNIGHRPTVDNNPTLQIEAHIHGLDADIYGHRLTLHFITRLRQERRFADLHALQTQLAADLSAALSLMETEMASNCKQ